MMRRLAFLPCLLLVAVLAAEDTPAPVDRAFKVVAHPAFPVDALSAEDLRKIFLGLKTSVAGADVAPVTQGDGPAHEAFCAEVMAKSTTGFRLYWRKQIFSGGAKAPMSFTDDEAALVAYVRGTPGAVGYVAAGTDTAGTKVLAIAE